jgi:hypothetical protein
MNEFLCKNCSSPYVYPYSYLLPKIFGNKKYQVLLCKNCGVGVTVPEPTALIDHYIDSDRPEIISDVVRASIRKDVHRMMAEYQRIFDRSPRSLLDVGCGNGIF